MTLTQSQITGLTTILGTLQPKLNNLNIVNNVSNSANALMTNFTPTDQITWVTTAGTGSYVNSGATNVNSWGYTENNGQTLTLAAGTGNTFDMFSLFLQPIM